MQLVPDQAQVRQARGRRQGRAAGQVLQQRGVQALQHQAHVPRLRECAAQARDPGARWRARRQVAQRARLLRQMRRSAPPASTQGAAPGMRIWWRPMHYHSRTCIQCLQL